MHSRNYPNKNKAVGIFLLVVLALLELALWGPALHHARHGEVLAVTCQGDHALCGCSPNRIAAKTCCCALAAIAPCCQKESISSDQEQEEETAFATVLTTLPCGASEDPLMTASSEVYLLASIRICSCPVSTTVYLPGSAMSRIDHHIPPPVPPPKV